MARKKLDEALPLLETALRLRPANEHVLGTLAELWAKRGADDKAKKLRDLLRIVRQQKEVVTQLLNRLRETPDDIDVRATLGNARVALGELDAAEAEFRRVLDTEPLHLAALEGLTRMCLRAQRCELALARFKVALATDEVPQRVRQLAAVLENAVSKTEAPVAPEPSVPPTERY